MREELTPAVALRKSTFATFLQIAQMDLILPRWGLILPSIPPPTPVKCLKSGQNVSTSGLKKLFIHILIKLMSAGAAGLV